MQKRKENKAGIIQPITLHLDILYIHTESGWIRRRQTLIYTTLTFCCTVTIYRSS